MMLEVGVGVGTSIGFNRKNLTLTPFCRSSNYDCAELDLESMGWIFVHP